MSSALRTVIERLRRDALAAPRRVFDESRAFREDAAKWLYTACTRAAERVTVVV